VALPPSIACSTRQGNAISNNTALPADVPWLGNQQTLLLQESGLANDPDVQPAHAVDATYNCVGFVFGSRRAVILPDQISLVLGDDQYVEVSEENTLPGDLVTWASGGAYQHVGMVIRMREFYGVRLPEVLSKWGFYGEFTHPVRKVPTVYGDEVRYWRVTR
jgi:hypothetical protein